MDTLYVKRTWNQESGKRL